MHGVTEMISMLISGRQETERKMILACAKDRAAILTDENWKWLECASLVEVQKYLAEEHNIDIICLDLQIKGNLEAAAGFRAAFSSCYIIIITDASISPISYMRPCISAQSLIIKPLAEKQLTDTIGEVISSYMNTFLPRKAEKSFVLEAREGKLIFSYDQIWFFESREKKVFLNTDAEDYGFYSTLDRLEERMDEDFLRVHRSYLINKAKIESFRLSQNEILMKGGYIIPISRTYRPKIKQFLEEMR